MAEFTDIIDYIDEIPYESHEILIDIINKRFLEKKRERFIQDTLQSKHDYETGNFLEGCSDELFKTLEI
ncbi:MAG: hypothetical protein HW421_3852 [Ignavibacteria bacterium]|nr:hypothetical protein [Ignavibacteria bacterium]